MPLNAGDAPTAAELAGIALRYIGFTSNNSSNTDTTTTEAAGLTLTWTAGSTSDRYLIMSSGMGESTVAADQWCMRLRYKAGASLSSPPSADTQLTCNTVNADGGSKPAAWNLLGTLTGISGQYTIGTTVVRTAGTGTVRMIGSSVNFYSLLILRLA